jgi:hypothetical protein
VESDYDPEIGYTVSFTHVEESGYYQCRVIEDPSHDIQFTVTVQANCEFNCSRSFPSHLDSYNQSTSNIIVDKYELLYGDGIMSLRNNNTLDMLSNLENLIAEDDLARWLDEILLADDKRKKIIEGLCCAVVLCFVVVFSYETLLII